MLAELARDFRAARVPLELPPTPLDPDASRLFQMDLEDLPDGERVTLWPGDGWNRIAVLDRDPALRQLVMSVREPRRRFRRAVPRPSDEEQPAALERLLDSESRLVRMTDDSWILESWTPGYERRLLVGYDDEHLFIAQVRWGDRVRDAHEALKPPLVRDSELRRPGEVKRQGEWFFVPVRPQERRLLDPLQPLRSLYFGGRHLAEEAAIIDEAEYARGRVTHPDHCTVGLPTWHRAVRNAAIPDDRWPELTWVD